MTSSEYHVDAATKYARPARFPLRLSPLTVTLRKMQRISRARRKKNNYYLRKRDRKQKWW